MVTTFRLVVMLLMVIGITAQLQQCQQMLKDWIDSPETLPPLVYANSGKFLNDLGDYNNCLYHNDQYVYFTLSVGNLLTSGTQNIGICAPLECYDDLNSNRYNQTIANKLNQAFRNTTKSEYSPFQKLKFYNPLEHEPEMDWSNYLAIILMLVLVFLGVFGSLLTFFSKSQARPIRIIRCFSFFDNFTKIISIPKTHDNQNLLFLNGVKVLSIFWVIYGHDQWFRLANIKNWPQALDILQTPGIATLAPAAYFAVDTFFWVGGFLVTIGMLEQLKKVKKFSTFLVGSLLHRFVRIWPTYMVAILIYWKIAPYFGSGPIWRTFYFLSTSCNNGGVLWNMFFIDNFENHGPNGMDYCFGWGWYLAVDFQLFLISPFILYAYHKNKKVGWLVTFTLFILSIAIAFLLIIGNDWHYPIPNPKLPPQPNFMDNFYYKPYVRASAYLMGLFTGFIYFEWKANNPVFVNPINTIKNSIAIRVLFYVLGIGLVNAAIWIIVPFQKGEQWSTLTQAFYNAFNRVFFLIGVFLCCFSSIFGCKHDPTRYLLGHWLFAPLAKVSFCMYLTHFIMIMDGAFSARMDLFWQVESSLYMIIADVFFSILLATCLTLLIESPVLGLEKILLRGGKGAKKDNSKVLQVLDVKDMKSALGESLLRQGSVSLGEQTEISQGVRPKQLPKDELMLL